MPSVGEMIHLCALAKVTSVSESEHRIDNAHKERCCRGELSDHTENQDEENRAAKWYGKPAEDAA